MVVVVVAATIDVLDQQVQTLRTTRRYENLSKDGVIFEAYLGYGFQFVIKYIYPAATSDSIPVSKLLSWGIVQNKAKSRAKRENYVPIPSVAFHRTRLGEFQLRSKCSIQHQMLVRKILCRRQDIKRVVQEKCLSCR